jgi:[protein-PII] uridylyltransferase
MRQQPAEMVRYFRVARRRDLQLYGHSKELIEAEVARAPQRVGRDPEARKLFLEALIDPLDARQPSLLEQMHGVGILSAVIPEFAPCTGRVQHDLYHVYTVDQHQLYAVALLKRIARGELAEEAPLATEACEKVTRPASLYLATLLHDVGKPLGKGHADKGARIAATVSKRLGLSREDAERAEFLVREHLTMAHISQRRDLSEPTVIEKFARRVGDSESLTQLYLLTRCDTAMTAPGNLSSWKDQLLGELYQRTLEYFGGSKMTGELAVHRRQTRRRAVDIVSGSGEDLRRAARADQLVSALDPSFVNNLNARQLATLTALALEVQDRGEPVGMKVECREQEGHSLVTIVARDKPSLLADLAGVLAAHRVYIDSAVLATVDSPDGALALDLFYVRDPQGQAIANEDRRWERILDSLAKWGQIEDPHEFVSQLLREKRGASPMQPRLTTSVQTVVKVHNDASEHSIVVEVFTEDRPGLLHIISKVLAEHGLDIHQAMVNTEGERASDAFYVRRDGGDELGQGEADALSAALVERLDRDKESE